MSKIQSGRSNTNKKLVNVEARNDDIVAMTDISDSEVNIETTTKRAAKKQTTNSQKAVKFNQFI